MAEGGEVACALQNNAGPLTSRRRYSNALLRLRSAAPSVSVCRFVCASAWVSPLAPCAAVRASIPPPFTTIGPPPPPPRARARVRAHGAFEERRRDVGGAADCRLVPLQRHVGEQRSGRDAFTRGRTGLRVKGGKKRSTAVQRRRDLLFSSCKHD